MTASISSERLDLIPMTPAFLESTSLGNVEEAAALLNLKIPDVWFECSDFAKLRFHQFETGVTSQAWLPRAMGLRETGEMVGFLGFHAPPGSEDLKDLSPLGVEFGYEVFPPHRRKGFAWEATHKLLKWANETHNVRYFVVSVSPTNAASLSMIFKMGFKRIGSHIDEEDGPEDIFELHYLGNNDLDQATTQKQQCYSKCPSHESPERASDE